MYGNVLIFLNVNVVGYVTKLLKIQKMYVSSVSLVTSTWTNRFAVITSTKAVESSQHTVYGCIHDYALRTYEGNLSMSGNGLAPPRRPYAPQLCTLVPHPLANMAPTPEDGQQQQQQRLRN